VSLRKALWLFCLAVSLVCLAGGYAVSAYWFVAPVVLAPIGVLLFSEKITAGWIPDACLFGLVCLAAAGLIIQAPPLLMLLGATAGLAAWDLENLDRRMAMGEPSPSARRFEQRHVLILLAALGLGLLLAALGRLVAIQIPFVLLLALVIFDLFSLDRVSRYLK
jgi:hypothetical protein